MGYIDGIVNESGEINILKKELFLDGKEIRSIEIERTDDEILTKFFKEGIFQEAIELMD